MVAFDRNKECICGTGIKYKNCCGKYILKDSLCDLINNGVIKINGNALIRKLNSDLEQIKSSFKNYCHIDLIRIGKYYGLYLLNMKTITANDSNLNKNEKHVTYMLINMKSSIDAALKLMESGYRLEPGLIFRNIYERISYIIYYMIESFNHNINPDKINSSKVIKYASKIINNIGYEYGLLSNNIVHINK